jgi:hypothetical protein
MLLKLKKPNIACFHSNMESRPKTILMMMRIIIIIMGHECKRRLLGGSVGVEQGKERVLEDEED